MILQTGFLSLSYMYHVLGWWNMIFSPCKELNSGLYVPFQFQFLAVTAAQVVYMSLRPFVRLSVTLV